MSTWNVTASVTIQTTVEADGEFHSDEAFDVQTNSLSGYDSISADGEAIFTVEADDEDAARDQAQNALDAMGFSAYHSDLEWEVTDAVIDSIERDEMTRDEAFIIVRRLLDRLVAESHITSEEREALDLVIQDS